MNFDKYKKELMDEKESIQRRQSAEKEYLKNRSELSYYDNHPTDTGSEPCQMEKDLALNSKDKSILEKIDLALDKMYKGNYGICENCGAKIPLERLEVIPYTNLCPKCENQEYEYTTFTKKFNDPIRYNKFGEFDEDDSDDTIPNPKLT